MKSEEIIKENINKDDVSYKYPITYDHIENFETLKLDLEKNIETIRAVIERPYEITISIGFDSLKHLINTLENIKFNISHYVNESLIEYKYSYYTTASKSEFSDYNFKIIKTKTIDHEDYLKQITEILEKIKE